MKNKKLLILVLMSVMATSAIFAQNTKAKTYKIGDDGPGGGIIFFHYEAGFDVYQEDGSLKKCHYLEVSKFDLGKFSWCSQKDYKTLCCNIITVDSIGAGKINTLKIIKNTHKQGTITEENCAALACHSYSTETTKAGDWFLPSRDELFLLYQNLGQRVLLSNTTNVATYWSSSQIGDSIAKYQNFSDGRLDYNCRKDNTYSVRAVRAF